MMEFVTAIRDHLEDRMKEYIPVLDRVDGVENWFQTEVIIGGVKAGYDVTVWEKTLYDADVVLNINGRKVGIELKMWRRGGGDIVEKSFTQHPKADYYLILHETPCPSLEAIDGRVVQPVYQNWSLSLIARIW